MSPWWQLCPPTISLRLRPLSGKHHGRCVGTWLGPLGLGVMGRALCAWVSASHSPFQGSCRTVVSNTCSRPCRRCVWSGHGACSMCLQCVQLAQLDPIPRPQPGHGRGIPDMLQTSGLPWSCLLAPPGGARHTELSLTHRRCPRDCSVPGTPCLQGHGGGRWGLLCQGAGGGPGLGGAWAGGEPGLQ